MNRNGLKRTLAAVLSLVIVGGAAPGAAGSGIIQVKPFTASAETTTQEAIVNFDSATSTLILDGCITYRDLEDYRSNKKVKHITCEYGTVFKGCESMFIGAYASDSDKWDWENVETIDLSYASFPEETSMYCMFSNLPKLTTVDFSRCSMPQVTSMKSMFKGCPMLTSVDLSDCSMPNVTDISYMFGNCQSLTSVDFSKTDTSSITIANCAFYKCNSLTSLDNVKFNTSNLTQAEEMFSNSGLTIADLSDWNTKKLRNAESFFEHCNSLGFVYLGDFGSDAVNIGNMFAGCSSLCLITTKRTESFIESAGSHGKAFFKCTSLVGGNGTACDGDNNTGIEYACIDTPETPGYFTYECCDLDSEGTLTLSGLVSWRRLLYYKDNYYNSSIKKIVADETAILPDDCSDLFSGFEYVEEIDLSAVNCDNITDVSGMFYGCSSLKTIDISGFDLSAVDTSDSAFAYCPALETIYVSTDSNRSDMSHSSGSCVFDNCNSLVGGSGTAFVNVTSVRYAHIDGGTSNPGYFSIYVDGVKYQDGVLTISKPFNRSTFSSTEFVNATKVIVTADAELPADCRRLFYDFKNATEIDLTNADLSGVTSMELMFGGCTALQKVKWCSGYKTQNVTKMNSMFYNCKALTDPGINGLNTSSVTDMSQLFNGCTSLKNLDLGDSFDTSSVTNMASMFKGCTSLIRLNLGSFDTSNVTSMATMFQNCSALTMFDLSNFSTGNVTSMYNMFSGCSSAKRIYVDDGWDTSSVTNDSDMFFNCSTLEGGNGTVFDSNYIDSTYACIDNEGQPGYLSWKTCVYDAKTRTLHLRGAVNYDEVNSYRDGHIEVRSIVADEGTVLPADCSFLFNRFDKVFDIDLSNADASKVKNMQNMFCDAYSLGSVTFGSKFNTKNVTSMKDMFYACYELQSLDLSKFNTAKVTDMNGMFADCIKLQNLDLSKFNTSKVTDMNSMFKNCWHLRSITLGSNFKTGNVTDMNGMFLYCSDLKDLDLSGFNTSKVTDMGYMFKYAQSLTSLDLTNFDTSCVTSMIGMFDNCVNLGNVDLTSFNTSNVKDMQDMFCACGLLTELDLSSFDTSNVENIEQMFLGCSKLKTILASDTWNTSNVRSAYNVFGLCTSLVGGNGTAYNYNNTYDIYARIDKPGQPGYLTECNRLSAAFKHNCSFQNDLSMYYAVPKESLSGYSNIRLEVTKEEYTAGASEPTLVKKTLTSYKEQTIGSVVYYMFTFDGITSTDMGSILSAVLRADKNGVTYSTKPDKYSIKDYAMDRLQNSSSATFKKMLVDMLNYGAAAQIHFNKNAAHLANSDLTAAQKAMGTQTLPTLKNAEKSTAVSGATATFDKKNVSFENKTVLMYRLKFAANQNMSNVKLTITYKTSSGTSVTKTIPASQFTKSGSYYIASIDTIAITDVRSVITAKIYDGSKQISNTFQYSIESYVYNRLQNSDSETFKNLVTEMMKFGISAETHFA